MSRWLALEIQSHQGVAVVVSAASGRRRVEGVVKIPFAEGQTASARGAQIAAALERLQAARLLTVASIPPERVSWQTYQLPPSPPDDLPQLVRMQAQRDAALSDDGLGFDYLVIEGDAHRPHRVLGFNVDEAYRREVAEACDAARLRLVSAAPTALGWLGAVGAQASAAQGTLSGRASGAAIEIGIGVSAEEATIWARNGASMAIVRQVRIPNSDDVDQSASLLANELRRTLLVLAQAHGDAVSDAIGVVGANARRLARALDALLPQTVAVVPCTWDEASADARVADGESRDGVPFWQWAPLGGLAATRAAGEALPVDLLQPRRPPTPPSRKRLFALASAAALAAATLVGTRAYRNLGEIKLAAQSAIEQRIALEPQTVALGEDERRAAAVAKWIGEAGHALHALEMVSQGLRPLPLDVAQYPVDQDIVAAKVTLADGMLAIDAAARQAGAVHDAEERLRSAARRVNRGNEPGGAATLGYDVRFSEQIEPRTDAAKVSGVLDDEEPTP